ncbi:MutS-like protein [Emydomyces testavorans]|uniref:MutS-like protein n=1 Tax=Emydomyces testavorans TaxID=2070801 RepID=A0AAF0DKK0_9EURO|nr:MutS-like protein [Emydomyces testavorans]
MAHSHMQLSQPFPIRSPFDKQATNKDYSYTAPLRPDGSDYPCKGYHKDPFRATARYQPGQEYTIKIDGSASHGGGSCQISLSYDNGQTFRVAKSIIGGCPLKPEYSFTVPSNAPSGNALLAWTWFNKIGNREMYMNCAQVSISGENKERRRTADVAFTNLPKAFIANIKGEGQCKTKEGADITFPQPGPDVEYGPGGQGKSDPGFACSGGRNATANGEPSQPQAAQESKPAPASVPKPQTSAPAASPTDSTTLKPESTSPLPDDDDSCSVAYTPSSSANSTTLKPASTSLLPSPSSTGAADNGDTPDDDDSCSAAYTPSSSANSTTFKPASTSLLPSPSSTGPADNGNTPDEDDSCSVAYTPSRHPIPTLATSAVNQIGSTGRPPFPIPSNSTNTTFPTESRNGTSGAGQSCIAGTIRCESETSFSLCAGKRGYIFMGRVAAGTRCRGGVIGY